MRFLVLDSDYSPFLDWLYARHPGLETECYDKQMQARVDSCFACGASYPLSLRALGHEAHQIFVNNEHIQRAWAREHGLTVAANPRWRFRLRRGIVPWFSRSQDDRWLYEVLAAQIRHYKPDVLINGSIRLSSAFFRQMKPDIGFLIGSHGSPLPNERDFGVYDLMLSVVANLVDYFRQQGLNSELLRLAFEPAVLRQLDGVERSVPISFVGQINVAHASRRVWLEHVSERLPVQVWGFSDRSFNGSPMESRYQGPAWGIDMYKILRQSSVTLNHHVDMAGAYAGNLRLFEATGVGTMLVTDWKTNLHDMFEPGKELVAYRSAEECVELVQYYLEHDEERAAIARAGQQRTLRDHTYGNRAAELVDIARKYLSVT